MRLCEAAAFRELLRRNRHPQNKCWLIFRRSARAVIGAVELSQIVAGRFRSAYLGKLTPEQQELFVRGQPAVFAPVKSGWGRGGATNVRLPAARKGAVRKALITAWRNRAPKRLAATVVDT